MKKLYLLLALISFIPAHAQISFKNQFEYTRWNEYDNNRLDGPNLVTNWADLTYQYKYFQAGLRYEANIPPDPYVFENDTLLSEHDLTMRYLEFNYKKFSARIGNFYSMFGRGLTLRTYEDRNLRVDNNIDGLKMNWKGKSIKAQAIAGKMRDKYNRRSETVYGFDGEAKIIKGLKFGASYIYQDHSANNQTALYAIRGNFIKKWWDIYIEAVKPDWYDAISYYGSLNLIFEQIAITLEYKDYNHLSFVNGNGQEYNAPPSLTREHSFAFLNRHPHALNLNDEKGHQIEMNYFPSESWEITLNHSRTLKHNGNLFFNEYYAEIHNYFNDNLELRAAGAYTFDLVTNTDNITPIFDATYNLSSKDQLHINFQHQHTFNKDDNSEYDSEMIQIEYSRSPFMSLALVGEYTNQDQLINVELDRHIWIYGQASFTLFNNQQLSILYGSRREGFVCVGGVCRYEPEFEGLELSLTLNY